MMQRAWAGFATVVVALAACGDDDATDAADASLDAEAIDAIPIDAVPAPVTVHVDTAAGPVAGAIVIFFDENDQILSNTTTDAAGDASAMVPAGGKVVAALSSTTTSGYLWLGVEPGDVLRLSAGDGAAPPVRSATVTVPARAGATTYTVTSECGSGSSATPTVRLDYADGAGCGAQDLLVRSYMTGTFQSFYLPGQTVASGATIDVSGRTYAPSASRTFTVSALPSSVTYAGISAVLVDGGHTVGPQVGANTTPSGGTSSASLTLDDVVGPQLLTIIELDDGLLDLRFLRRGAQAAGTFDHAALRTRDALATSHIAGVFSWTESGSGVAPQGAYVALNYNPPAFWHGGGGISWRVIGTGITSVRLPPMPSELAQLSTTGRTLGNHFVTLFHHSLGGATVRQRGFGARADLDLLPADSTMVTSERGFGAL